MDLISTALVEGIKWFATTILPKLWKIIVDWVVKAVKRAIAEAAIAGFKYFLKEVADAVLEIMKTYEQKGRQWYVNETVKAMRFNDVPSEIANRTKLNKEVDCSNELEEKLELVNWFAESLLCLYLLQLWQLLLRLLQSQQLLTFIKRKKILFQ